MGYGTLLFNWHIFLNNVFDFNFDARNPKTNTLNFDIWLTTSFVAEQFYFASSLQSICCYNSISLVVFFSWEVWLSSLLIQKAPEQMWIEKGVAKEECTYLQLLRVQIPYETLSS